VTDNNELNDLGNVVLAADPQLYWRMVVSLALRMNQGEVKKLIKELELYVTP